MRWRQCFLSLCSGICNNPWASSSLAGAGITDRPRAKCLATNKSTNCNQSRIFIYFLTFFFWQNANWQNGPDWAQLRSIQVYKDHATISSCSIPIASTFCISCWLRTSIPSHLRIPTVRPRRVRWGCSKGRGNEQWTNEREKSNHYNKA